MLNCCYLILLLAITVPSAIAQVQNDIYIERPECTNAREHLKALEASLDRLCSEIIVDYDDNEPCCSAVWESIPLTPIGYINMGNTTDQSFIIPYAVPPNATEVLVYVWIKV